MLYFCFISIKSSFIYRVNRKLLKLTSHRKNGLKNTAYIFVNTFAKFSGRNPVEVFFFFLKELQYSFQQWLYQFTFIPAVNERFLQTSPTWLFILFLLIKAILTGVRWQLILILMSISLIASEVEHLFIYLLAVCMSSWEKCLFRSSVNFFFKDFIYFQRGWKGGREGEKHQCVVASHVDPHLGSGPQPRHIP